MDSASLSTRVLRFNAAALGPLWPEKSGAWLQKLKPAVRGGCFVMAKAMIRKATPWSELKP
jgi:hypothetical protein